ncbi:hypothetical protein CSUI_000008 [Cystoisospora suis]|uniref:Uncharacterized protein n=1 Tax=Cystoisospora suis TaxID=483139 RepID=A0A2C6LI17_9APIC|nr:hypothetical protein CSUI_000008 [Cystoisospora suis]
MATWQHSLEMSVADWNTSRGDPEVTFWVRGRASERCVRGAGGFEFSQQRRGRQAQGSTGAVGCYGCHCRACARGLRVFHLHSGDFADSHNGASEWTGEVWYASIHRPYIARRRRFFLLHVPDSPTTNCGSPPSRISRPVCRVFSVLGNDFCYVSRLQLPVCGGSGIVCPPGSCGVRCSPFHTHVLEEPQNIAAKATSRRL